jgi:hypothetical protein
MEISPDPLSLKRLLTKNQNWHSYYQYHQNNGLPMREEVPWAITQILSCKNYVKGHAQYYCSNKSCLHEKRVPFTCKHRMCNSCGKVASDKWVAKQKQVLPKCSFQHITFTMPCELWPIFERNRHLLNKLPTLAAQSVLKLAKKKNIKPGIFTALHTFGRDLKWNCHVHLSVTRGGLSLDLSEWKNVYFPAKNLMSVWRHGVTKHHAGLRPIGST